MSFNHGQKDGRKRDGDGEGRGGLILKIWERYSLSKISEADLDSVISGFECYGITGDVVGGGENKVGKSRCWSMVIHGVVKECGCRNETCMFVTATSIQFPKRGITTAISIRYSRTNY